jgi:lipopolysaccharide exporter
MSLKLQVIKGIRWSVIGSLTTTFIQFLQNIILARLLLPEDFGLMTMALVFVGFIVPIFDLGLSAAIIQKKEINSIQLSTLYWFNISLGIICFVLAYSAAPLASLFFERDDLVSIVRITASIFLISPWGSQYSALLTKNLRFDLQNKIAILSVGLSFIIAVSMALNGYGVLALVIGFIFLKTIETILYIYFGRNYHKLRFQFNLSEVKGLLYFGLFQTGTALVNFLSANIDKLLIGKLIGPHALGLYTIAWNLVLMPLRKINPMVNKITFSVFSRIQDEVKRVGNYYTNAVLLLMFINFPILLFLVLNASDFLDLLYGEKWLAASTTLSILAMVGLLKSFANPGGSLILSKGRADIGFYWNIGWTITLFLTISVCLYLSATIEMVALGQLLAGIIIGPIWHWLIFKYGKISYKELLLQISILTLFTIPAYFLVYTINQLDFNNMIYSFFLKLLIGGLLYILYLFIFFRKRLPLILNIIK